MSQIHQNYVPTVPHSEQYTIGGSGEIVTIPADKLHPILLRGDQLTVARARSAKKAKINSVNPPLRLDGLIPVAEDWHARLNFMEVKGSCNETTIHLIMACRLCMIILCDTGHMEVFCLHRIIRRPWDTLPAKKSSWKNWCWSSPRKKFQCV